MSKSRFDSLCETIQQCGITAEELAPLGGVMRHSAFLATWLCNNPDAVPAILAQGVATPQVKRLTAELTEGDLLHIPEADFMKRMRRVKMREYAVIVRKEMDLSHPLEDITAHISTVASATLSACYAYAHAHLAARHGVPMDEAGEEVGMAVIGLGKLGGWELNFSSDVDLMYVYGTEVGQTAGVNGGGVISNHEFFTQLGNRLVTLMSTRTEDGIVFRVDLRLRPDGDRGAIALSLRSYEIYYESYGQTWERMMLLKARCVAGDAEVASRFTEMIRPFVFRRTLDYRFIEDLMEVKQKIDRRVELKGANVKHVKLGYGGIREIEFVVQALQIMNYPKNRTVHNPNSLASLKILPDLGVLEASTAATLDSCYRFLRKLEHMAMIEREAQTHTVPEGSDSFPLYLERCGFESAAQFEVKYKEVTDAVNSVFNTIFKDEKAKTESSKNSLIFDEELSQEEIVPLFVEKKVREPEKCAQLARQIVFEKRSKPRLPSEKKILRGILTHVVDELPQVKDPLTVLGQFEKLFSNPTNIYLFHEIFTEAPALLTRVVNIFATSRYLSETLLRTRNIIDYVYDPKVPVYTPDDIRAEYRQRIQGCDGDMECEFDMLRDHHKELIFNLGYSYVNRELNVIELMHSLSTLAHGTVAISFERVWHDLVRRHGRPVRESGGYSDYVVIGMGKLGSREMSFGSDLDLIVLYDEVGTTDGEKQITNREFYSKLVQKAILYMSTVTYKGYLYKVDMRLRPSGASGTLVTTLKAFEEYQLKSAMLWEKQALARAGVVNTDSPLTEQFYTVRMNALKHVAQPAELAKEVQDMRLRIEREKGQPEKNDFKAGFGGMIDIEFAVQLFQLLHGQEHPELYRRNTHDALHYLHDAGLMRGRDFEAFHRHYLFYRNLENVIRIQQNNDASTMPKSEMVLEQVGAFFGYTVREAESILTHLADARKVVRGAFNRVVERVMAEK